MIDPSSSDIQIREYLSGIAETHGVWRGYVVDSQVAAVRDLAEKSGLVLITPEGGGFDYAEEHKLLPQGYAFLGLPVPVAPPSVPVAMTRAAVAWLSSCFPTRSR